MLNKSAILVSFLFVLSLAITGCGGGGNSSVNPTGPVLVSNETASLSGIVSFDSNPTPFASVYLYRSDRAHTVGMTQLSSLKGSLVAQQIVGDGAYSTTTNEEGAYNFVNIPVGQYTLIAVRDENHQSVQTGVLLCQVTTLNPQLTPTGKITGNVSLSAGGASQGVAGVFVYINGTSYIAVTDTAGNFTINNVPSNTNATTKYEVLVMTNTGTSSPVTCVAVNPRATTTLSNITLTARTATGHTVLSGSFVAGNGVAGTELAQQFVIINHKTSGTMFGTFTDTAGHFQFRVYETGTFLIHSDKKGYSYSPEPLSIDVGSLNNETITLQTITVSKEIVANKISVSGTVTWPAVTEWSFIDGEVILEGANFVDRRIVSNVSPATFRFDNVPAGTYTLKSNPLRNGYEGSVSITVNEGIDLVGQSLPTTLRAPVVTAVSAEGRVTGSNLGAAADNPEALVDGRPVTISNGTGISCDIDLSGVAPGQHVLQMYTSIPALAGKLASNKFTFTIPTQTNGINNIQESVFTGNAIHAIFGFEVVGNTAYVAFLNPTLNTPEIIIQSFNLTTNSLENQSAAIRAGTDPLALSFAADSSGVYLTYSVSEPAPEIMITKLDSNLAMPTTKNIATDFTIPSPLGARVKCLNNRIFLIARVSTSIELRELNSAFLNAVNSGTISAGSNVSGIDITYDPLTNTIYSVHNTGNFIISAFSNMDITIANPIVIGQIDPDVDDLHGLYAYDNKIYLTKGGSSTPPNGYIATADGYISPMLNNPSSVGFDKLGRVWIYHYPMSNAEYHLLQVERNQTVQQSLRIFDPDVRIGKAIAPKLDATSGMMYMLHLNFKDELAVYKYNSSF